MASMATDVTVPNTVVVAPSGVTTAWSPTFTWPTSVSSTVPFTTYVPSEITTIWLLDDEVVDDKILDALGHRHSFCVMRGGARLNDLAAGLLRRDLPFAYVGARMAEVMSPLDHGKAERELGWKPEPVEESIRKAARFFATNSAN